MTTITGKLNAYLTAYSSLGPDDFKAPTDAVLGKLHFAAPEFIPKDWTLAGEATITVELVDSNTLVANKVAALRGELQKVKADAYRAQVELEAKINKLLAITHEVAA